MAIVPFTSRLTPTHSAALYGNTASASWRFEVVTSDEGDLSSYAEQATGEHYGVHPCANGWILLNSNGERLTSFLTVREAVQSIVKKSI